MGERKILSGARARAWFPERQIYHRSDGQVSYITISTNAQLIMTSLVVLMFVWVAFASLSFALRGRAIDTAESRLIERLAPSASSLEVTFTPKNFGEAAAYIENYVDQVRRQAAEHEAELESLRAETERLRIANSLSTQEAEALLALLREAEDNRARGQFIQNMIFLVLGVAGSFFTGLTFFIAQKKPALPPPTLGS